MRISATAKIVLVHRRVVSALVVIFLLVFVVSWKQRQQTTELCAGYRSDIVLRSQKIEFGVEVAKTKEAQKIGLSGRPCIGENQAMLFEFEEAAQHCIWMKDMQFVIDVVWLNDENEVTKTVPAMQPSSYPQSFCPDTPAKRVLELPEGGIDKLRLDVGSGIAL